MARSDPQISLRIPADTKRKLEECAKRSGRSITAELVMRLESTFNDMSVNAELPVITADVRLVELEQDIAEIKGVLGDVMEKLKDKQSNS